MRIAHFVFVLISLVPFPMSECVSKGMEVLRPYNLHVIGDLSLEELTSQLFPLRVHVLTDTVHTDADVAIHTSKTALSVRSEKRLWPDMYILVISPQCMLVNQGLDGTSVVEHMPKLVELIVGGHARKLDTRPRAHTRFDASIE